MGLFVCQTYSNIYQMYPKSGHAFGGHTLIINLPHPHFFTKRWVDNPNHDINDMIAVTAAKLMKELLGNMMV